MTDQKTQTEKRECIIQLPVDECIREHCTYWDLATQRCTYMKPWLRTNGIKLDKERHDGT